MTPAVTCGHRNLLYIYISLFSDETSKFVFKLRETLEIWRPRSQGPEESALLSHWFWEPKGWTTKQTIPDKHQVLLRDSFLDWHVVDRCLSEAVPTYSNRSEQPRILKKAEPGVSSSDRFRQNPSSRYHRLCTRSLTRGDVRHKQNIEHIWAHTWWELEDSNITEPKRSKKRWTWLHKNCIEDHKPRSNWVLTCLRIFELILEAHSNPVSLEGKQFFDQTILRLL